MSEKVIKSGLLKHVTRPVIIEPPKIEHEESLESSEDGEILQEKQSFGPSAEELEQIIEDKKREAKEEAKKIIKETENKAKQIKNDAENWAFDQVKKVNEDYETKIKEAQLKADQIEQQAKEKATQILAEANAEAEKIKKDAHHEGFEQGRELGYNEGSQEVERLVKVLHQVSGELIKKREELLKETEEDLINLVILIANKVVKSMNESHKRIVYDNILAALAKLRVRSEVTIRVNPEDIFTVTKYKQDFIDMIEEVENLRILEDPNVDKGGCIVSSEFGSIDARISTQLAEIEDQIKKLSPLKHDE